MPIINTILGAVEFPDQVEASTPPASLTRLLDIVGGPSTDAGFFLQTRINANFAPQVHPADIPITGPSLAEERALQVEELQSAGFGMVPQIIPPPLKAIGKILLSPTTIAQDPAKPTLLRYWVCGCR